MRVPSDFSTSTARPRPTSSWWSTPGFPVPSTSGTKLELRAGTASSARTTAKPMRWVKLTFPPEVRARCWLRIARLTSRSLAGTERTLVAVGTDSDAAMFCAMRAAAPRNGVAVGAARTTPAPSAPSAGAPAPVAVAGAAAEAGGDVVVAVGAAGRVGSGAACRRPAGGATAGTATVATPPGT